MPLVRWDRVQLAHYGPGETLSIMMAVLVVGGENGTYAPAVDSK